MNTAIIGAMPTINPFSFDGREVRTVLEGETVWFCAKDVFEALGIGWAGMKGSLPNTPEKWVMVWNLQTTKGERDMIFVSEPAVYQTLFRSKTPDAIRFTEWVCEEVLPAIRKTGFYGRVEPRTRVVISKQVSALVAELVGCRNLMQQEYLIGEIRDLCNMIGKPMPDMTKLHTEIDQRSLPLGGGAA